MKIKIIKKIPLAFYCRPRVGEIYEVESFSSEIMPPVLFIRVHGYRVNIYRDEMEVVEE